MITLIAVAVTVWALFFRKTAPVLAPDYAPQEAETHAEAIPGDSDDEKMETSSGGGAVSMVYQKEIQISLSSQTASLMFQNPSKSVNDIVLQLAVTGSDGTGKFNVLYYDPDTGEKSVLNSTIEGVAITVVK